MTSVLLRKEDEDKNMHGRRLREVPGEESHGQVREETTLRRNQPDPHSNRGLPASGTEKTNLGYLTCSVCGLCYSSSSRLTHCHTLYIATSVL